MTVRELINSDLFIIGGYVRVTDFETLEDMTESVQLLDIKFSYPDLLDRNIHAIWSRPDERILKHPDAYYSQHNSYTVIAVG